MKVKLIFKQRKTQYGYNETMLTHIKSIDEQGNYIKFEKHDPELIEKLQNVIIEL